MKRNKENHEKKIRNPEPQSAKNNIKSKSSLTDEQVKNFVEYQ